MACLPFSEDSIERNIIFSMHPFVACTGKHSMFLLLLKQEMSVRGRISATRLVVPFWRIPGKGKKVRFGFEKGLSKPKSRESWLKVYTHHKYYLHNVKHVQLQWKTKGPGLAGIRRFNQLYVPPLQFWNPDITFRTLKVKNGDANVTVTLNDESQHSFDATNLNLEDIHSKIKELSQVP
eukprot:TRINITY_DN4474_c0_g1_i2.p1 TRINITY_DN4474_c0_g1~~TRINITY_DN4474_c0_g1_i2.p1  ORF type:complete len:179 (+),score=11.00 TRINITY_DN4474_c0_g1_i2:174-710(+)